MQAPAAEGHEPRPDLHRAIYQLMETERCATMGKQLMRCSSSSADRRSRDVRFVGIRSFELIDGLHPVWHILLNDV